MCFQAKFKINLDRVALTLSSTLRHLSAPHKEATRFSLSSSWLRFCTHSFTVTTRTQHMTIQHPLSYVKVNSCTGHLVYLYTDIYTNEVTSCSLHLIHLPLSTIWSKPPSSRSSSLNQSPALLEVRESSVSMARWPVYNKQRAKAK